MSVKFCRPVDTILLRPCSDKFFWKGDRLSPVHGNIHGTVAVIIYSFLINYNRHGVLPSIFVKTGIYISGVKLEHSVYLIGRLLCECLSNLLAHDLFFLCRIKGVIYDLNVVRTDKFKFAGLCIADYYALI